MRHLIPAMKNKYGGHVEASDTDLKAYNKKGELVVHVSMDGNGSLVDNSAAAGLAGRYDLSPIPKVSRLYKQVGAGRDLKLEKVKDYEERKAGLSEWLDSDGFVKSCEELEAQGYKFDKNQVVEKRPAK